jgi:hypothetical protein
VTGSHGANTGTLADTTLYWSAASIHLAIRMLKVLVQHQARPALAQHGGERRIKGREALRSFLGVPSCSEVARGGRAWRLMPSFALL